MSGISRIAVIIVGLSLAITLEPRFTIKSELGKFLDPLLPVSAMTSRNLNVAKLLEVKSHAGGVATQTSWVFGRIKYYPGGEFGNGGIPVSVAGTPFVTYTTELGYYFFDLPPGSYFLEIGNPCVFVNPPIPKVTLKVSVFEGETTLIGLITIPGCNQ